MRRINHLIEIRGRHAVIGFQIRSAHVYKNRHLIVAITLEGCELFPGTTCDRCAHRTLIRIFIGRTDRIPCSAYRCGGSSGIRRSRRCGGRGRFRKSTGRSGGRGSAHAQHVHDEQQNQNEQNDA